MQRDNVGLPGAVRLAAAAASRPGEQQGAGIKAQVAEDERIILIDDGERMSKWIPWISVPWASVTCIVYWPSTAICPAK